MLVTNESAASRGVRAAGGYGTEGQNVSGTGCVQGDARSHGWNFADPRRGSRSFNAATALATPSPRGSGGRIGAVTIVYVPAGAGAYFGIGEGVVLPRISRLESGLLVCDPPFAGASQPPLGCLMARRGSTCGGVMAAGSTQAAHMLQPAMASAIRHLTQIMVRTPCRLRRCLARQRISSNGPSLADSGSPTAEHEDR